MPYVRYEDLYQDPNAELTRILQRWGLQVEPEAVRAAVSRNELQKLKRQPNHARSGVSATHFRQGGHGGYKQALSAKLQADVATRFGDYLRRWGYSID